MSQIPPPQTERNQAERWFMRMQMGNCTSADRAACARWRLEDPAHAAAYAEVERVFQLAKRAGEDPRLRAAARLARERLQRKRRRGGVLRWTLSLASAAVLVLALGIGWRSWNPPQPEEHYATAVGERRTLTLDDGSVALLDTDSSLAVRYSRLRREVVLERGQAQFTVASQPKRPFLVHTGLGTVRAVGTEFQVRRRSSGVEVMLIKGVVEISAATGDDAPRVATLAPGEQLDFDAAGRWDKRSFDPESAKSWTEGQLVFRSRPLAEVAAEMNRYNTVKIRLGQPALDELKISGQFYSNDPASLIQALELGWSLRAERSSTDEVVLYRRD
ncbi:FecR family protein [Luteimonas kalidii]|uniref:FecR domain-containing protein n=1 Tax=Luteimonas kalidii TaxID=3042025 RepID=A0ABT6JXZ8_9GAMM|nr:FecR domain-containing protein [Luteimonas kalidii]MDH5835347.1 FecR domain-containing protein [Luteimonas kalidii]